MQFPPAVSGGCKRLEAGDVCPICLNGCLGQRWCMCPACERPYHRTCIGTWLSFKRSCPACRIPASLPANELAQSLLVGTDAVRWDDDSITLGDTDTSISDDTDDETDSTPESAR